MRYGIEITNLGDYADPRTAVRLARAAEEAGWEGMFVRDHLAFTWGVPSGDPWVTLSAVAASTTRLKLGTAVTPLARRRLQVVANSLATLDLLSEGRVIFGAGLGGVEEEFSAFGEPADAKERATMLEEGLLVLGKLFSGDVVTHHGDHYTLSFVEDGRTVRLLPLALGTVIEETPGVRRFHAIKTAPKTLSVRLEVEPGVAPQRVWEALSSRLEEYFSAQGVSAIQVERSAEPPRPNPRSGKFRQVWAEA